MWPAQKSRPQAALPDCDQRVGSGGVVVPVVPAPVVPVVPVPVVPAPERVMPVPDVSELPEEPEVPEEPEAPEVPEEPEEPEEPEVPEAPEEPEVPEEPELPEEPEVPDMPASGDPDADEPLEPDVDEPLEPEVEEPLVDAGGVLFMPLVPLAPRQDSMPPEPLPPPEPVAPPEPLEPLEPLVVPISVVVEPAERLVPAELRSWLLALWVFALDDFCCLLPEVCWSDPEACEPVEVDCAATPALTSIAARMMVSFVFMRSLLLLGCILRVEILASPLPIARRRTRRAAVGTAPSKMKIFPGSNA
jgi:hypothetical protein